MRTISPSEITPVGLADYLTPAASTSLRAAAPEIRAALIASKGLAGRATWMVFAPSFAILTTHTVLRIILRIAVELMVGIFAPQFLPIVDWILSMLSTCPLVQGNDLVTRYAASIGEFLHTAHAQLSEPALAGIANPSMESD